MYRRMIILLIAAWIISGCSPRIIYRTEIEHSRDTVIRERIHHDTVSVEIEREVEKVVARDSVSHLENRYASSDASIDSLGYLHHSLESRPQIIYVPVEIPVADTTVTDKTVSESVSEIQVEKPLTWWQRFQMGGFWAFLAAIAAMVYMKIKKI